MQLGKMKAIQSRTRAFMTIALVAAMVAPIQAQSPGAAGKASLPTNGSIESRIGPLAFEGGYPNDATVEKLYDEMDFQRATQCYLWAIPIVSFAKWQEQHENVFGQKDGDLVQMVSSRDKLGMLTPNDSTTYLIGFWNLERTGPMVIDYPRGPTAGGIVDMWQRPITDQGLSGPDKGEGGKYLILPPGQKAPEGAEGYRIFECQK